MRRLIKKQNNKIGMRKSSMKSEMTNYTSENVAAAGTDSNTKFKLSDDLPVDLLKALNNFRTVMDILQNKDFNADKPRHERYVKYCRPVSLPLFTSDMDDDEEITFFDKQRKLANEKIKLECNPNGENQKNLRNAFSNAVTTGRRSGSGRIITENLIK